jgi:hypothetical protein
MELAWTTATLGRVKKPIPLKKLLSSPAAKPVRQSWQTMYAIAAAWAGAAGEIRSEGRPA